VLRGFGRSLVEVVGETSLALGDTERDVVVRFPRQSRSTVNLRMSVEPRVAWCGETALLLAKPPAISEAPHAREHASQLA
jgi:hypothetical protein